MFHSDAGLGSYIYKPLLTFSNGLFCVFVYYTTAPQVRRHAVATLRMAGDDEQPLRPPVNRGVSINQDGESNVWAIEPKMEIDTKSSEEKSKGAIIAVGGLVAFTAVAAFVLTNLPDPNQF